MIHTVPGDPNLWSIAQEELMERMTESTKSVFDRFGRHICYINVLRNMSVSCDCEARRPCPWSPPTSASWPPWTSWPPTRRRWT